MTAGRKSMLIWILLGVQCVALIIAILAVTHFNSELTLWIATGTMVSAIVARLVIRFFIPVDKAAPGSLRSRLLAKD
jgi:uncharacterized membrane-anchored protein YitT (DUF2179 family)